MHIANSGDLEKLRIKGRVSDNELMIAWESIVKANEKENGTNRMSAYMQLMKAYALLVNDHTVIRACLVHLYYYPIHWEYLEFLNKKGYTVDIDNKYESIKALLRRCDNLVTKYTMKRNEIDKLMGDGKEKAKPVGFEELIANLHFALGFPVDENITLSRYNEYNKILKARVKAQENGKRSDFKR